MACGINMATATYGFPTTAEALHCNGKRKIHFRPMPAKQAKFLDPKRLLPEYPVRDVEDSYLMGHELGVGAFGTTYMVYHHGSGNSYACKTVWKAHLASQDDLYDMRNEVRILNHLVGTPNIVTLVDVFEEDHAVHLITNLCSGGELYNRILEKGRYSEAEAAPVIYAIVKVIQTCHSMGVMHRDLKTQNILFVDESDDANLELIDFGLSTFFKAGDTLTDIVGTATHMAPEMLNGQYGPEVDIWSAGVILCTLLTGNLPFRGATEDEIKDNVKSRQVDFASKEWKHVSAPAKALIRGMLRKIPGRRFYTSEILAHPWIRQHVTNRSSES